jgi:hypothetical protein
MCFSAPASFIAGSLLTVIGGYSLSKTESSSQKAFAAIPLLFGLQQLAEGVVWIALGHVGKEYTTHAATYAYLFFAQTLWPLWVPLAMLLMVQKEQRKFYHWLFLFVGSVASVFLSYYLLNYTSVAAISGKHITYTQHYPLQAKPIISVLYAAATIGATFFTKVKYMALLGITISLSYVITTLMYDYFILSVWCFFASIISLMVYAILVKHNALKNRPGSNNIPSFSMQ